MNYTLSAEYYDLLYGWKDYAGESARLRELIEQRRPGARTLLDVACGTGQHLAHLRRWYDVAGIDGSVEQVAVARRRLEDVPLEHGDMRDFALRRAFDVITCLFGSVAYLSSAAELDRAVANMARHLAPGGLLIVEPFLTPDRFDPLHLSRPLVAETPELTVVRMNGHRVLGPRRVALEMHFLVARPGTLEHFREDHAVSLFSDDDFRAAFAPTGLDVEHDAEGLMGRGLWVGVEPR